MNNVKNISNQSSLNRTALSATVHCLTGCAIGETLGMLAGTSMGWGNAATIVLSVALAFLFGYAFTLLPILKANIDLYSALKLVFASDTLSIAVMEIIDNGIMLVIPGAMEAGLSEPLFWLSMVSSLIFAGIAAFPLNRWLISQNRGHAVIHRYHDQDEHLVSRQSQLVSDRTEHGHHIHHA